MWRRPYLCSHHIKSWHVIIATNVYIEVGSDGDGTNMAFIMMQRFWNPIAEVKEKMLNSLI
jgi:hypothetical protein